jgi:1,4-dihydroxy-2-naphthoate octaprenyltransferase
VSYSTPPLKLGYRPFNELFVVLPALVGVVVGTDLVMTGSWSWLAIAVGWVHAMFCISWFIVSRVPDYEPDKAVDKITSVVYLGRDNAAMLSAVYATLALVALPFIAEVSVLPIAATIPAWVVLLNGLRKLDAYDPDQASGIRLANMRVTTYHALSLAGLLAVSGV